MGCMANYNVLFPILLILQFECTNTAVPIDIVTEKLTDGKLPKMGPAISLMIPEKEPLISRRYRYRPTLLHYDSYYVYDENYPPFRRVPMTKNWAPSIGFGTEILYGQVLPLLKEMILGSFTMTRKKRPFQREPPRNHWYTIYQGYSKQPGTTPRWM